MLYFTYCESVSLASIAQPFNAFSSAGFFIAALALYRQGAGALPCGKALLALTALIGFGSAAWHATQAPWALWLDMLPILAFLMLHHRAFSTHCLGWSKRRASLALLLLLCAIALCSLVANGLFLQKSNAFVPAVLWLAFCGFRMGERKAAATYCFAAAGTLTAAILMRIVDMPFCGATLIGTHFLWHGLSALTLYFAMRALACGAEEARHDSA